MGKFKNDDFFLYVERLAKVVEDLQEKARSEALEPRVRAAYSDAVTQLNRELSELEFMLSWNRLVEHSP